MVADVERSLPVLVRLAQVSWNKPAPVGKVMAALAWMLRIHGGAKFEAESQMICARWASESAEVQRLEKLYFPDRSDARAQAEQEDLRESKELRTQMEAELRKLRENDPQMFGPDGPVARRERIAAKLNPPA
jgi:hypothetical protein